MKALPSFNTDESPQWLLSFDFDGTLAVVEENPPTRPEFFELMVRMRSSHRICWGINTGRSLMQTLQGLADARFPFLPDYIIAREREIYMPNDLGRWVGVLDWNERCHSEHHKLFQKCKRFLKGLRCWVEKETAAIWGMQEAEPAGIVASTASEMDVIVRKIEEAIRDWPKLSYQRNGIYLRFSHHKYHKGSALGELARILEVPRMRAFAIGDGHNDLDMLDPEFAGMLACPANACDEVIRKVRGFGGYVACEPASAGAIEAIHAMILNTGQEDALGSHNPVSEA